MKLFKKSNTDNVYHFAVVGLPNSGKSTFLARLYGASTMSYSDSDSAPNSKNDYLISFGLATETDPRKCASLAFIQNLWNDITSHSNKEFRGKTADKSYLTFRVEGGSIKGRRIVETADIPGDIFRFETENRKDAEYVAAGLKDENIRKFKEEFKQLCPICNAVLIVVDAEMFDKPDRRELIKSTISDLTPLNENGVPIFKIIAVSKSASRIASDGESRKEFNRTLKQFEKKLCSATKTKGLIRCVACDALEDLVKEGDGWRLPKHGESVNLPEGVITPSEVMKMFFDMEAAFNAKRYFKIITSSILFALSLLGIWCWQGISADKNLYREAEGQPAHIKREKLENYLLAPLWGRLYFPQKCFQIKAKNEWRKLVFDRNNGTFYKSPDGHDTNLDDRSNELNRLKTDLYKFIGDEKFRELQEEQNKNITTAKIEWEMALSNAVENLHKTCAAKDDLRQTLSHVSFDKMPSLTNKIENILKREIEIYSKEEDRLRSEKEKLSDQSDKERYYNNLNEISKQSDYIYCKLQEQRKTLYENAWANLNRTVNERPCFIKEAVSKFKEIFNKFHIELETNTLEENIKKQMDELNKKNSKYNNEYNNNKNSEDKLNICIEAINNLKDHPSISMQSEDGWQRRKTNLTNLRTNSEVIFGKVLDNLNNNKNQPLAQIEKVQEVLNTNGSDLSPETKNRLEEKLSEYKNQWVCASNAWMKLTLIYEEFQKDKTNYNDCHKELNNYKKLVYDDQGRREGIKGHDVSKITNALNKEEERINKLKSEYQSHWDTRSKHEKEIESFEVAADKLADLLKTRDIDFAKNKINDWMTAINQIEEDCTENSTDEEFKRTQALLTIRRNYEDRLGLEKKGDSLLNNLQSTWNDKHLEATLTNARSKRTVEALDAWIEYFNHNDEDGWQAYRNETDKPKVEFKRLTDEYAKELKKEAEQCKNVDITPSVYKNKMEILNNIETNFYSRNLPTNPDLNNTIRETRKNLNEKLLNWHKNELNNILEELCPNNKFRVLTKWDQLEKIDNRLKKMNESENVKSQLPEDFYKKWQDRKNKLEETEFDIGFKLDSFKFKIKQTGDGDTPTKFMPGFALSFSYYNGKKKTKVFSYEEKEPNEDPKHLEWGEVTPGDENHKYIIFTGNSNEDFKEPVKGVKMKKNDDLLFVLHLMKSSDNNNAELPLLTDKETPAALLYGDKKKFDKVVCPLKYKSWNKYNFEFSEFNLTFSFVDPSCLDDFKIPSTANEFFEWIEK